MAAFITTPETISAPADPDEPSSLTTLPAEMRNCIHEILFKRNGPVLLHNTEAYYPKLRGSQPAHAMDNSVLAEFDSHFEIAIARRREFVYDFQVSLLLSCRQIYHESIEILYKHNSFTFS
jgi:hypothetical protein